MMPDINWSIIYPELIVCGAAFLILMLDLVIPKAKRWALGLFAFAAILIALMLIYANLGSEGKTFFGMVTDDLPGKFFKVIFCLGAMLAVLASLSYQKREFPDLGEFYVLMLLSTFGMMIMASSLDLIAIFLGLEMMSIPLYILAGIYRKRYRSQEAALKYFLMGAFASGFMLYGIALIYGAFGSTNLYRISQLISSGMAYSPFFVTAGSILILVGLAFKAGLVPFHMWIPDVYEGAPAPVTAFMSAGPKAAAIIAILRVFVMASPVVDLTWVFWALAAFTMTWGNILALTQTNVKRMLAYSSIAHAGYMMVAVTAGGYDGIGAAAFYMFIYTLMNIGAFAIVIYFADKGEVYENISDYAGLAKYYPASAIAMTIFLASLGGIPGTAGFMGKFAVFSAAINNGYIWLAIIGVLNSLISIFYYLRIVVMMYMKPQEESRADELAFSPWLLVAVAVALLGIVYIGVFPDTWMILAKLSGLKAF
jgi:NADH-quinone oxidoreductase subunit N